MNTEITVAQSNVNNSTNRPETTDCHRLTTQSEPHPYLYQNVYQTDQLICNNIKINKKNNKKNTDSKHRVTAYIYPFC